MTLTSTYEMKINFFPSFTLFSLLTFLIFWSFWKLYIESYSFLSMECIGLFFLVSFRERKKYERKERRKISAIYSEIFLSFQWFFSSMLFSSLFVCTLFWGSLLFQRFSFPLFAKYIFNIRNQWLVYVNTRIPSQSVHFRWRKFSFFFGLLLFSSSLIIIAFLPFLGSNWMLITQRCREWLFSFFYNLANKTIWHWGEVLRKEVSFLPLSMVSFRFVSFYLFGLVTFSIFDYRFAVGLKYEMPSSFYISYHLAILIWVESLDAIHIWFWIIIYSFSSLIFSSWTSNDRKKVW